MEPEEKKIIHFNLLNSELNPIYHLLALLGAHPVFHVSKIRVKQNPESQMFRELIARVIIC
jgi:hypothetical protein